MLLLWYQTKQASDEEARIIAKMRQTRITQMVAIVALLEFCLDVVPLTMLRIATCWSVDLGVYYPSLSLINELNRISTLFVYVWKMQEFRQTVRNLFGCKPSLSNQVAPGFTNPDDSMAEHFALRESLYKHARTISQVAHIYYNSANSISPIPNDHIGNTAKVE